MKLLVRGGRIIDPAQGIDQVGDLLLVDGVVAELLSETVAQDAEVIDASGLLVVPGLVDMHVHLREPGGEDAETIESGTRAACVGGFTSVAAMPNTKPPIDNAGLVAFVAREGQRAGLARVYPVGAVSQGLEGKVMSEIGDMIKAGAVAFSDNGKCVMDSHLLRRAIEYTSAWGVPVICHSEDMHLSENGMMHEGFVSTQLGLKGIPREAEEIMVFRDVQLARLTGGKVHIAHISTEGSVEIIRWAKSQGVSVTAEATPHHCVLTHDLLSSYDTNLKVNPPLREARDVEALRGALADGTIDAIASDHAPHTQVDKEFEFSEAPHGLIGLESTVGLVLTELVGSGVISIVRAVELMSQGPAEILSIKAGTLAPGYPGDVTILDAGKSWTLEAGDLQSLARNCPYLGREFVGKTVATVVDGVPVYQDGRIGSIRGRDG